MNTIVAQTFARAGLLGNPSDGYHGKTISFVIRDFFAEVRLAPSQRLIVKPNTGDGFEFDSLSDLADQISLNGYYGGVRLIKAAAFQFYQYCKWVGASAERPCSISYSSCIPKQVGLAGSSAIVIAAMKALAQWHDVEIEPHLLPSLALRAENALKIAAGLQDRVVQSMGGVVYMDFATERMNAQLGLRYGEYEPLSPALLSNIYVAYSDHYAEPTEVLHNDLRQKFESGDTKVIAVLDQIAELAEQGKRALHDGDQAKLAMLIDRNFDLRREICKLHPAHVKMVEAARACGASAKYCGSGGAIVGTFPAQESWATLQGAFTDLGVKILRPQIAVSARP